MDFITAAILSGIVYDITKTGVQVTAQALKEKMKEWVLEDATAERLAQEVTRIPQLEDLGERALQRNFEASEPIMTILATIKSSQTQTIVQNHSGSGDNVAGNKIVNN